MNAPWSRLTNNRGSLRPAGLIVGHGGLRLGAALLVLAGTGMFAAAAPLDSSLDDDLLAIERTGMDETGFDDVDSMVVSSSILLETGELHTIAVDGLTRVALGNPSIADISIVSADEVLLQAISGGTTNLILWDSRGQQAIDVEVIDRASEELEATLNDVLLRLELSTVRVEREGEKLFLVGEVQRDEDLDQLEQMLTAYPSVTNIVTVAYTKEREVGEYPETVRLTVKLIEMTLDGSDKLGVDWDDSQTFSETTFSAPGLDPEPRKKRLTEAFRLGSFARTGLDPTINMLVSEGKAHLLAEPKLVAASGREAVTIIGIEIPVITATSISSGTVTQDIEFRQTGVELKFTPTVLSDGNSIELVLDAKVSSIDTTNSITVGGIIVPGFRIRQTQTEIITESGEAVFISGLLQEEEKKELSALPGVGNIPVLGALFKSKTFTEGQSELVIIVTPELVGRPAEAKMAAGMDGPPMGDSGSPAIASEPPLPSMQSYTAEPPIAGSGFASSPDDPTLRYALRIQDQIASSLHYPQRERERGIEGQVKLRLHVSRSGVLEEVQLLSTSGVPAFDETALDTARRESPYPPFPTEITQPDLWLELPILFQS